MDSHAATRPNGIISYDTFARDVAALDPAAFEAAILGHGRGLVGERAGAVVAVDETPNEIAANPALLETLGLTGWIVTIDAFGCQRAIAAQLVAQGADYVLALNENQPALHNGVATYFKRLRPAERAALRQARHTERDHGRRETRTCLVSDDPALLAWLDPSDAWAGLRSVAMVTAERRVGETLGHETRYAMSSLPADEALLGVAIRGRWVFDETFREHESRVRSAHAVENLAVPRHEALELLRQERTENMGGQGQTDLVRMGRLASAQGPRRPRVDSPASRQSFGMVRSAS